MHIHFRSFRTFYQFTSTINNLVSCSCCFYFIVGLYTLEKKESARVWHNFLTNHILAQTKPMLRLGYKYLTTITNDSDEFSEEVIYPQGSPKVGDVFTDYDWDLDRFVEYKSPLKRKEILSPGNNSSHWNRNKNYSSVIMIGNHQRRNEIKKLKNQIKKSR